MSRKLLLLAIFSFALRMTGNAQLLTPERTFTHADTLRGSITPERAWWNLLKYELHVTPDYDKQTVSGENAITFQAIAEGQTMQIDLQEPMNLLSATWGKKSLSFVREGNVFHLHWPKPLKTGEIETVLLKFEGKPRVAVNPPWDGGWIWTKDKQGRPWMTVAYKGLGASVWFPCKDHLYDEPDSGVVLSITAPDSLVAVGNGRLRDKKSNGHGTTTWTWAVISPINSYDIIPYIGKYVKWSEQYKGLKGNLDCNFWVLDYNLEKARPQFKQVDTMLDAFEYWMGPYPFYEDGYKLVEAPHLGMENQSNVAYGNHFENGYLGHDLSGTGWGLKWDYIIVHESGHEWFGNSITDKDAADMWIHEGFTDYTETLFTTYMFGVEAGNDYTIGLRKNIANASNIIGTYDVNKEGSGDMYFKGANLLHMIRQIMGDSAFRGMLHGMQRTFYHQTVTTQQIEDYMSRYAGKDFSKIFDQYLRTTQIPVLVYQTSGDVISYRWGNFVKGFNMPIKVFCGGLPGQWVCPPEEGHARPAGADGQIFRGGGGQRPPAAPAQQAAHPAPVGPGPRIQTVG